MTWAKLDDRANEHEKQLTAGAKACWLWACGLMFCNRNPKQVGLIPKLVAHNMLYPGLGAKEAKRLVEVGLWEDVGTSYLVHNYRTWNPELSEARAAAGRVGGLRSGEARREANPKQVASSKRSNQEANGEATLEAPSRAQAPAVDPDPLHSTPLQEKKEPPSGARKKVADATPLVAARRRPAKVTQPWPEDFEPDESCFAIAREASLNALGELAKARDWAASKGHRCKDWQAFFRNWLRKAAEIQARQPTNSQRSPDWIFERARRITEEEKAKYETG